MYVIDFAVLVVLGKDDVVETHLTGDFERGLEPRKTFHCGVGLDEVVALENRYA